MLSAPLENAFNNESRGFAVSPQLPGCLLLFGVAYFLSWLVSWITLSGFVLQSLILYCSSVCWWPLLFFNSVQEIPISGIHDWQIKKLWLIIHSACGRDGKELSQQLEEIIFDVSLIWFVKIQHSGSITCVGRKICPKKPKIQSDII